MSVEPCGPDGCGSCTLACAGDAAPDAGEGLAVVAATGVVVAVLAGMLAIGAPAPVATVGGATAGAGLALAGVGVITRRHAPRSAPAALAQRLVPFVTGALIITVSARAAGLLLA